MNRKILEDTPLWHAVCVCVCENVLWRLFPPTHFGMQSSIGFRVYKLYLNTPFSPCKTPPENLQTFGTTEHRGDPQIQAANLNNRSDPSGGNLSGCYYIKKKVHIFQNELCTQRSEQSSQHFAATHKNLPTMASGWNAFMLGQEQDVSWSLKHTTDCSSGWRPAEHKWAGVDSFCLVVSQHKGHTVRIHEKRQQLRWGQDASQLLSLSPICSYSHIFQVLPPKWFSVMGVTEQAA